MTVRQASVCRLRTPSQEVPMYERNQTTTVAIKPCRNCGAGLIDKSNFCRACGAPQTCTLPTSSETTISFASGPEPGGHYSTTPLSEQKLYHPVSGPLVSAVVAGVPPSMPRSPANSLSRRILLALMAIPIWVMIILMSPLDAYASAKIIGSRI